MINRAQDYAYYDGLYSSPHHRRCIDGSITGSSKCVGYCEYSEHKGFLSEKLRNERNCIAKGCNYYLPKQQQPHKAKTKDSRPNEVISIASAVLSSIEGLKILRADKSASGWILKYITISNSYSIGAFEKSISEAIGETVIMKDLNYDFDAAAKMLFA